MATGRARRSVPVGGNLFLIGPRRVECSAGLRKKLADDLAMDISQPEVAALELIGQPGVIEAKLVQDRSMHLPPPQIPEYHE